jgi:hypothetical protein
LVARGIRVFVTGFMGIDDEWLITRGLDPGRF